MRAVPCAVACEQHPGLCPLEARTTPSPAVTTTVKKYVPRCCSMFPKGQNHSQLRRTFKYKYCFLVTERNILQRWVFYSTGCWCPVRAVFRVNIIPQDGTGWQLGATRPEKPEAYTYSSCSACTTRSGFPVCCCPHLQHCANTQTQERKPPSTRGNCPAGTTHPQGCWAGAGPRSQ